MGKVKAHVKVNVQVQMKVHIRVQEKVKGAVKVGLCNPRPGEASKSEPAAAQGERRGGGLH